MILGYHAIRDAFRPGGPWQAYRGNDPIDIDTLRVNPNSVDVTLSNKFIYLIAVGEDIPDVYRQDTIKYAPYETDDIVLDPRECIIGAVNERFQCHNPYIGGKYVPMYEGRSTMGRLFVASHVTAGFGDYGFEGAFTLEIVNHNPFPIKLHAGMRIGQVYWIQCMSPCEYTGSYSVDHNLGPVAPKLGRERFV